MLKVFCNIINHSSVWVVTQLNLKFKKLLTVKQTPQDTVVYPNSTKQLWEADLGLLKALKAPKQGLELELSTRIGLESTPLLR